MQIYDIATPFLHSYEPTKAYYEQCFHEQSEIYDYYFELHCRNKEEKLENALIQHTKKIEQMLWIAEKLKSLTPQITAKYEKLFPIKFTKDTYIFVGLGGSNAYTYRSMNPDVAFCVEKFEQEEDGLKVIVAHEFGHAAHHLFTTYQGIEAKAIDWMNPYTWLFQEGMATYLSTMVVDVDQDIYFAFKRDPKWLAFCEANQEKIIAAFSNDLMSLTSGEIFKEWFSINGGQIFGYDRIAYYIGYKIVEHLVKEQGIEKAMIYWGHADFQERMKELLKNVF